jgi:hypothetical protein
MFSPLPGLPPAWRRPAVVLLLVITAFLLAAPLLDLLAGEGDLVIIDGNPEPGAVGALAWGRLATTALIWLAGLFATARSLGRAGLVPAGRGRLVAFLAGWVVAPVLLAVARDGIGTVPYADRLIDALLLALTIAAQAPMLARPRPASVPPESRTWPYALAPALALALSIGIVVQNPYEATAIRTGNGILSDPVAVAWPAGQHPVIVTVGGVRYCDDDRCSSFHGVTGSPAAIDGYSTTTIGADGTVVKAAVGGGPDTGGPFVQYARCVRDGCRTAYFPVRTSAADKLDLTGTIEVTGASAPDGALWFFLAAPIEGGARGRYRFSLIRCAVTCAGTDRHVLGEIDRTPADGYPDGRRTRLTIGADGRPAAAFWMGYSILRFSCDPLTCAHPRRAEQQGGNPGAVWMSSGERALYFTEVEVSDGAHSWRLHDFATGRSGALAFDGEATYVAAAVLSAPPDGFQVTVGGGRPAQFRRETVWRCAGSECVSVPLDTYAGDGRRELLAVGPDGRVLIVRDDRVLLADPF